MQLGFWNFNLTHLTLGPEHCHIHRIRAFLGYFWKNHKKFKYCSIYSIIWYNVLEKKSFVMLFIWIKYLYNFYFLWFFKKWGVFVVFDFFLDLDLSLTLDLLVLATTSDSDSELPLPSHSYSGSMSLSTTPRSNCSSLDCVSKSERCLFAFLFSYHIWRVKSET